MVWSLDKKKKKRQINLTVGLWWIILRIDGHGSNSKLKFLFMITINGAFNYINSLKKNKKKLLECLKVNLHGNWS